MLIWKSCPNFDSFKTGGIGYNKHMVNRLLEPLSIRAAIENRDLERLRQIALETRNEVQAELRKADPETDWMRNPEDLEGACAIANYRLWLRLKPFGARLFASNEHCYLVLPNSPKEFTKYKPYVHPEDLVVDITATQYKPFKNTPVLVLPYSEVEDYDWDFFGSPYRGKEIKDEAQAARFFKKWPETQIPFELLKTAGTKHDARLDLFDSAFRFVYALREEILRQTQRYSLRTIPNDFNNRIDIQPIPDWRQRLTPHSVDADRKIYLTCAFTLVDPAEGEVIIDIAVRVRGPQLAVVGYYKKGTERIDLISDTTFVSEGSESNVAAKILDHLRTAWKKYKGVKMGSFIKISVNLKKAIELDSLETFSVKYNVPDEWIDGACDYLMENGLAIKSELDALKETTHNEMVIEFKKHDGIQQQIDTGLQVDPSFMTVSYGPYVVDDYMKDKTLTPEMVAQ